MLWLIIGAFIAGYFWGAASGIKECDKHTEYWYQESRYWMARALGDDDPDDEDGDELPIIEAEVEPVKAMAKAAGTYS